MWVINCVIVAFENRVHFTSRSLFVCIENKKHVWCGWRKRKLNICRLSAPDTQADSLDHLPTSDPDVLRRFLEWRDTRHRKHRAIGEWCISGRFWRIWVKYTTLKSIYCQTINIAPDYMWNLGPKYTVFVGPAQATGRLIHTGGPRSAVRRTRMTTAPKSNTKHRDLGETRAFQHLFMGIFNLWQSMRVLPVSFSLHGARLFDLSGISRWIVQSEWTHCTWYSWTLWSRKLLFT